MIRIQPVYGAPALRLDDTLVIGDLHIGMESDLFGKGFRVISRTTEIIESVTDVAEGCSRLLLLGDVKDSVPGTSRQESTEIPLFFEKLLERFSEIDVVKGNHDTGIEKFLPDKVRLHPASGMIVDDVGFIHGHTWPSRTVMSAEILVMAHEHPAVILRDGAGRQRTEPCWLRGTFKEESSEKYPKLPKEFVVIPAFNRMLGGSPVNAIGERMLGPVLNSSLVDLDNAHVFLLDGLDLGKRADILTEGHRSVKRKDVQRRAKYS